MKEHEATQIIDWFVAAYPTQRIEPETTKLWKTALAGLDGKIASAAALAYIQERRTFPTIAGLMEIYRGIRRSRERDRGDLRGLPEPQAEEVPEWVERWRRARAAGDRRLFPEQIPGIKELHFSGGSPPDSETKYPGWPSGYEEEMRTIAQVPITDREHWVQPDEYLSAT